MSDSGVSAVAQKSGFQSKYWTQPTRINHRETPKNEASSRFPSQHRLAPTITIFLYRFLCQLLSQRKTSKKFLVQHRNDTPGSMLLRIQLPSSLKPQTIMAQEPCDPRQVRRQLLSSDMAQNLAFIGSLPGKALTQVLLNVFLELLWNRFGFIGCYNWWLSTRPKDSIFLCLTSYWTR